MVSDASERKARLSVCVVEHNPLAADHVRQILQREPDFEVSLFDPQLHFRRFHPDRAAVFVLDQGTLSLSLHKLLRFLRLHRPKAKILLLDHSLPDDELCRLLFLGIQGFLPYDEVEADLIPALRAVLEGHYWMPPRVLEQYVSATVHLDSRKAGRPDVFTRHERRIIELVKRRLSNKEITQVLRISEGTVKFHLANVFAKLGVRDRYAMLDAVRPGRRSLLPLPHKPK